MGLILDSSVLITAKPQGKNARRVIAEIERSFGKSKGCGMTRPRRLLGAVLYAMLVVQATLASPGSGRSLMGQIRSAVSEVRTAKSSISRTEAAERLAQLTQKVNPAEIDDKTMADMVSLLDSSQDSIRAWVAAALGNLGPRAKASAPKLLKILSEVDCRQVSVSSAPFIRVALTQMGVKPPPSHCDGQ